MRGHGPRWETIGDLMHTYICMCVRPRGSRQRLPDVQPIVFAANPYIVYIISYNYTGPMKANHGFDQVLDLREEEHAQRRTRENRVVLAKALHRAFEHWQLSAD